MTTREEALEQGWLTPAPTFFGEDAIARLSKCAFSPWVVIRRTVPKLHFPPMPGEREETRALREKHHLPPAIMPVERPFMYVPKAAFR